jgi:hypothetical protein
MEKLQNPGNNLTPEERKRVRELTANTENTLKASLVNLLMGQFSKIAVYDTAIQTAIQMLTERARTMSDEDLIAFCGALAKVNASESKNVLDLFKKHDSDLKTFLKELQKVNQQKPIYEEGDVDEVLATTKDGRATIARLSPEKKEKFLKLFGKLKDVEVEDAEVTEVKEDAT